MRVNPKKKSPAFQYLLVSDSGEATSISKEMADELEKNGTAVEEIDEENLDLEVPGREGDEGEEPDGDEPVVEDEDENHEEPDGDEPVVEDEDETAGASGDDIFEVELAEGIVGKMDKTAYDYCKRFLDAQKKGDSAEVATAKMLALTSVAGRILGASFKVDSYLRGNKFDSMGLKKTIIKHQMPHVVVDSLKNEEAINALYKSAVTVRQTKTDAYENDMAILGKSIGTRPEATARKGMVEDARSKRLLKLNGGK